MYIYDDGYVSPNLKYPEQRIQIGTALSGNAKDTLCKLLTANIDVFAWEPSDMTGVPREIAQHRLNVNPNITPVVQKKRAMALERSVFLDNKVQRLVHAGIMKQVKYQTWVENSVMTDEVEKAFQDVKAFLKELSTLTAPIPGEILTVYLAASSEAISSVLIADRGKTQMPVYFVSKLLQNREVNYPAMEKLIYALVHTARRLRRYFQVHPIQVFTDQPIKHILTMPKISERMAKWAIELGEHEITFLLRYLVKGQVIANFLVELPSDMIKQGETTVTRRETDEFWELYTDEASSEEGAGIGLLLVSPKGEEITYAILLKFASSNNEAEYEALIAGLCLANSIDVRQLTAYVDSQLVASQLNGSFKARDTSMQKYLELMKALTNTFAAFEIKQIPRNRNKKVDALSKLASLLYDHFTKKFMVEVLERKSTEEDTLMATITIEEECWMTPFIKYLADGTLPADKLQARWIRMRAPTYNFKNGVLYMKSFTEPYLSCVGPTQAKEILREMHEGACSTHFDVS
ncbi:uncharacterized protein [Rutidosis leptorrhynchoides]|uniref:uncharacterized protein n=1 Tax=Rutidosis leptorrhynchoides TaxID=125765 RepID=UPI003A9A2262